jgi:hypothetical protein
MRNHSQPLPAVFFLSGRMRDELRPIDARGVAIFRIDNQRGRILRGQRSLGFSLETISSLVVSFAFLFHFSVSLRERVLIFSDGHAP